MSFTKASLTIILKQWNLDNPQGTPMQLAEYLLERSYIEKNFHKLLDNDSIEYLNITSQIEHGIEACASGGTSWFAFSVGPTKLKLDATKFSLVDFVTDEDLDDGILQDEFFSERDWEEPCSLNPYDSSSLRELIHEQLYKVANSGDDKFDSPEHNNSRTIYYNHLLDVVEGMNYVAKHSICNLSEPKLDDGWSYSHFTEGPFKGLNFKIPYNYLLDYDGDRSIVVELKPNAYKSEYKPIEDSRKGTLRELIVNKVGRLEMGMILIFISVLVSIICSIYG